MDSRSEAIRVGTQPRIAGIVVSRCWAAVLAALAGLALPAWAGTATHPEQTGLADAKPFPPSTVPADDAAASKDDTVADLPRWYLLFACVNTYPGLESEEILDDFFNRPMRILAPGYDNVKTFGDTRDDHIMWPPHFGVGRILSEHWNAFLFGGYSAGTVHTEATNFSLLLLPLHHDVQIDRGAAYAGAGLDYSPFGMAELGEYKGLKDRLRAAKPSLGARYIWTYATYDAQVKVGFKPFGNIVKYKQSDAWLLPSVNLNVGANVPLSPHGVLTMDAGYTFFWERDYDFAGWNYTLGYKWFFK